MSAGAFASSGSFAVRGAQHEMTTRLETEMSVFSLRVANATVRDLGLYTCTVQNDVGSSSLDITLLEGGF